MEEVPLTLLAFLLSGDSALLRAILLHTAPRTENLPANGALFGDSHRFIFMSLTTKIASLPFL
jgi:hypothetical protein